MVAAVRGRDVVLTPRLHPLHRPADLLGQRGHEHVLGVEVDLRPEAAADVRRDAAHLVSGIPNTNAVISSRMMCGVCERHPDRVAARARVVCRRGAAHFHRRRDQSLVDEPLLDDDVRLGERLVGRVGVAARPVHHDVAGRVLVQLRCAVGDRGLDVDDDVERLAVDLDQIERVLGRVPVRAGDDDRDAGAGVRDAVDLERPRRVDEVLDASRLPRARQPGEVLEVLAGEDGDHARVRSAAFDVSMLLIRACANGERRIATCVIPAAGGRRGTSRRP